ncbi:hypothetical protein [Saccharopolyspora shandongensis]|uniref:hypothetical protein n=1 Tax=Saccharopolyspora shandongensis TaxID=418495 RepID=UPI0033C58AAA
MLLSPEEKWCFFAAFVAITVAIFFAISFLLAPDPRESPISVTITMYPGERLAILHPDGTPINEDDPRWIPERMGNGRSIPTH